MNLKNVFSVTEEVTMDWLLEHTAEQRCLIIANHLRENFTWSHDNGPIQLTYEVLEWTYKAQINHNSLSSSHYAMRIERFLRQHPNSGGQEVAQLNHLDNMTQALHNFAVQIGMDVNTICNQEAQRRERDANHQMMNNAMYHHMVKNYPTQQEAPHGDNDPELATAD